jgi:hypothetical protein
VTNEEVMKIMFDMGLHDGGMENWIPDNAWVRVVNKAVEIERDECAAVCIKVGNDSALTYKQARVTTLCANAILARGEK